MEQRFFTSVSLKQPEAPNIRASGVNVAFSCSVFVLSEARVAFHSSIYLRFDLWVQKKKNNNLKSTCTPRSNLNVLLDGLLGIIRAEK